MCHCCLVQLCGICNLLQTVWYSYVVLVICYRLFTHRLYQSIEEEEEEDSGLLGCDAVMMDV